MWFIYTVEIIEEYNNRKQMIKSHLKSVTFNKSPKKNRTIGELWVNYVISSRYDIQNNVQFEVEGCMTVTHCSTNPNLSNFKMH